MMDAVKYDLLLQSMMTKTQKKNAAKIDALNIKLARWRVSVVFWLGADPHAAVYVNRAKKRTAWCKGKEDATARALRVAREELADLEEHGGDALIFKN